MHAGEQVSGSVLGRREALTKWGETWGARECSAKARRDRLDIERRCEVSRRFLDD